MGNQQNIQHREVTKKNIMNAYSHRFNSYLWKYSSQFGFYDSVIADTPLNVFEKNPSLVHLEKGK